MTVYVYADIGFLDLYLFPLYLCFIARKSYTKSYHVTIYGYVDNSFLEPYVHTMSLLLVSLILRVIT